MAMWKVEVKRKKKQWIECDTNDPEGLYVDRNLMKIILIGMRRQEQAWDILGLCVGLEGGGKSNLAFLIAYIVSYGEFKLETHIAFNPEDAEKKAEGLPKRSPLVIDEAVINLMSTDAMNKEQKSFIKVLSIIRQKELFIIVVMPSFFNLTKYVATHRANFLIKIYAKDGVRGRFAYWTRKRLHSLYMNGKKFNSYSRPKPNFRGRFLKFKHPTDPDFDEKYDVLKKKSLASVFKQEKKLSEADIKNNVLAECLRRNDSNDLKITQKNLALLFGVSDRTISRRRGDIEA